VDIRFAKVKIKVPQSQQVLFNIPDLTIPSGEKWLLQGASGQGKTTFLHLIAGLLLPDEGSIDIGPHRLNTLSDDERCVFRARNMGIVFQKLNLLDHLTPLENMSLVLKRTPAAHQRAQECLEQLGLGAKTNVRSSVLSLGEQQRVAVARILASEPSIILADEPTSSLDEANAERVMNSLFEAGRKATMVVVSHDHRIGKWFKKIVDFKKWVPA
jgi:putative ABC transport system ATP-binding protein